MLIRLQEYNPLMVSRSGKPKEQIGKKLNDKSLCHISLNTTEPVDGA
jgi:hypothetical protein